MLTKSFWILKKLDREKKINIFHLCSQRCISPNLRLIKRKIIIGILIICIIVLILRIIPQKLQIHFIDVGQGDSSLIITPMKKSILIDGGGSLNDSFDVGEKTLLPYLLDRRITKVDYIIITHMDQDHVRPDFLP